VLILIDVRCADGHVTEQLVDRKDRDNPDNCSVCAKPVKRVLLTASKVSWSSLASGPNATADSIDKHERMRKQQKDKEEKCLAEHGDYGVAPGANSGSMYKPPA